MRNIVQLTLRAGEKQAQPKEQWEDDDGWTMPNGAGWRCLRQRLARALAAGTDINTLSGTDNTEWMGLANLSATFAPFTTFKGEAAKEDKR